MTFDFTTQKNVLVVEVKAWPCHLEVVESVFYHVLVKAKSRLRFLIMDFVFIALIHKPEVFDVHFDDIEVRRLNLKSCPRMILKHLPTRFRGFKETVIVVLLVLEVSLAVEHFKNRLNYFSETPSNVIGVSLLDTLNRHN